MRLVLVLASLIFSVFAIKPAVAFSFQRRVPELVSATCVSIQSEFEVWKNNSEFAQMGLQVIRNPLCDPDYQVWFWQDLPRNLLDELYEVQGKINYFKREKTYRLCQSLDSLFETQSSDYMIAEFMMGLKANPLCDSAFQLQHGEDFPIRYVEELNTLGFMGIHRMNLIRLNFEKKCVQQVLLEQREQVQFETLCKLLIFISALFICHYPILRILSFILEEIFPFITLQIIFFSVWITILFVFFTILISTVCGQLCLLWILRFDTCLKNCQCVSFHFQRNLDQNLVLNNLEDFDETNYFEAQQIDEFTKALNEVLEIEEKKEVSLEEKEQSKKERNDLDFLENNKVEPAPSKEKEELKSVGQEIWSFRKSSADKNESVGHEIWSFRKSSADDEKNDEAQDVEEEVDFEYMTPEEHKFKMVEILGEGSFGVCWKVMHTPSHVFYAAKYFKKEVYDSQLFMIDYVRYLIFNCVCTYNLCS